MRTYDGYSDDFRRQTDYMDHYSKETQKYSFAIEAVARSRVLEKGAMQLVCLEILEESKAHGYSVTSLQLNFDTLKKLGWIKEVETTYTKKEIKYLV